MKWDWTPSQEEALQLLIFEARAHQALGPIHPTDPFQVEWGFNTIWEKGLFVVSLSLIETESLGNRQDKPASVTDVGEGSFQVGELLLFGIVWSVFQLEVQNTSLAYIYTDSFAVFKGGTEWLPFQQQNDWEVNRIPVCATLWIVPSF